MADDLPKRDFLLEYEAVPMPPHIISIAETILANPQSGFEVQMLARCIIDICQTHNHNVVAANSGCATVRVYEHNIHDERRR